MKTAFDRIIKTINGVDARLKPCPFCNKDARVFTNDFLTATIQCRSLACGAKIQCGTVNTTFVKTLKRAEKAWNHRPK